MPSPVYFALVPDLRAAAIGTERTFLGDQSPFEKYKIAGRFIIDGFRFDIDVAGF